VTDEKIGPLLGSALGKMDRAPTDDKRHAIAASVGGGDGDPTMLPVVVQLDRHLPEADESWDGYSGRVTGKLGMLADMLRAIMGADPTLLVTGNALKVSLRSDQIRQIAAHHDIKLMELDPVVVATCLDDVQGDIDIVGFGANHPGTNGQGVSVAIVDTGVDTKHPCLTVAQSISTCGESVDIPGEHGTHCAGILASSDTTYPGVAPGVSLINVKVLRRNGQGQSSDITRGIDEAIKAGADVISMSLGFNHLPTWSNGGHGWSCPQGHCTLCTSVDNAVRLGKVVVVAAGNEHENAEALRKFSLQHNFDTELRCPGQARMAITVGAITKRTFLPASFSARGPTADQRAKPALCAPGVNITSTIPMPRDAAGQLVPNAPRSTMFGRMSGTSQATPVVAGAAALVVALFKARGATWTPAQIEQELTSRGVSPLPLFPADTVGAGRLLLTGL
jgi:subtilisin family serine protease